ncbi:MAG: AraC family transcriptional regulator [Rhodobacteraceae bacterium]|nr:AraC family transcriptional regulator [Paracoccaceae bacterium]
MAEPSMAAGFAAAFLAFTQGCGADRAVLMRAASLGEDDLAEQDNRIPVAAYQALIAAAIRETGDTAILLRHTFETRLETMSIVGQIVHHSASLAHSIDQLNRYLHLISDVAPGERADRYELREDATGVWIIDHMNAPKEQYIGIEASLARFISEFRRSFPGQRFAIEMEVRHAPPPHIEAYPELFRVPVRFNAARNAIRIDPIWLTPASGFEPGNAYAFGVFARHADALMERLRRAGNFRARVEAQILPHLHEGSLSMEDIAHGLAMSRQTLYRRLKEEGASFAEIHDDLRKRMALDYLEARKASVNETAYLLGFSEASSFVRAFRRWTGHSPTAYLASLG